MRKKENLVGDRYTRLVVQSHVAGRKWVCKCDCGTVKVVDSKHLRSGATRSCGCLRTEESSARRILPSGEASFNHLYSSYRRRADQKKIQFSLTKGEFSSLINQNCTYCGGPPTRHHFSKGSATPYICNGVDRVDNAVGYTIDNSVPCCGTCNRMKSDMSVESFLKHVNSIATAVKQ